MNEVNDLQKRRCENLIWNAAEDYTFSPDFKAYDCDGNADIYWNTIIGSARLHYDYPKFTELFKGLDDECINVFWTALEDCLFEKEVSKRPVLYKLKDRTHSSNLKFTPEMSTDEIVAEAKRFFALSYNPKRQDKKKHNLIGIRKNEGNSKYHKFLNGKLWHSSDGGGVVAGTDRENENLATKMSESELRCFMETKFGKSVLTPSKTAELEKNLCRGSHRFCHLLITDGEKCKESEIQNGFEALSRQREKEQILSNRRYYKSNIRKNRTAINTLAGNIQNSLLLHLEPAPVKSSSGILNSALSWRAVSLDDEKVFSKNENDNIGGIMVAVLLDASTSQKDRLETISSQAYIIAEALKKCSVPCKVMSFCSMTGYTVIRNFRQTEDIFEYVAYGCNRDGLAVSTVRELLSAENYEHKILIVLSDVKPNDVIKIRSAHSEDSVPYDMKEGINNTALEVRKAKAEGISVICIFTGEDSELPSARMVYNRDFVRIHSVEMLSDAVGKLIQNQIKNM